mmetsp:Transcript_6062/g.8411  ORF Transcript_6062/g.8411 Transcript_6062/m.8411 type:complete len:355 (+) Transcript_6062:135-1199(+)
MVDQDSVVKAIKVLEAKIARYVEKIQSKEDAQALEAKIRRLLNKFLQLDLSAEAIEKSLIPKKLRQWMAKFSPANQVQAKELLKDLRDIWRAGKGGKPKAKNSCNPTVPEKPKSATQTSSSCSSTLPPSDGPSAPTNPGLANGGDSTASSAPVQARKIRYKRSGLKKLTLTVPVAQDQHNRNKIPTLVQICTTLLRRHISMVECLSPTLTGRLPTRTLQTCLAGCSAEHLAKLERNSPYIKNDTDHLWKKLYKDKFGMNAIPKTVKSWREEYERKNLQQERIIKASIQKLARRKAQREREKEEAMQDMRIDMSKIKQGRRRVQAVRRSPIKKRKANPQASAASRGKILKRLRRP